MHVAIVGAGALGMAYAAVLQRAGCQLTLVVRKLGVPGTYRAKRIGVLTRWTQVSAQVQTTLPRCDVALLTVRAENVNPELLKQLARLGAPTVALTPSLEEPEVRLAQPGWVWAMPSVLALREGPLVEYYVPPLARTRFDASARGHEVIQRLRKSLNRGGVSTAFTADVQQFNRITTLRFFPLQLAIAREPNLARWSRTPGFSQALRSALRVAGKLSSSMGRADPAIRLAAWALGQPGALWAFSRGLGAFAPWGARFLTQHFGHKLRVQTLQFAAQVPQLALAANLNQADVAQLLPGPLLLDAATPGSRFERSQS